MLLFLQKIRKFIQMKLINNFEKCFTALNLKILSSRMLDVSKYERRTCWPTKFTEKVQTNYGDFRSVILPICGFLLYEVGAWNFV